MTDGGGHEWHRVASTDELDEDEPKGVKVGSSMIAIFQVGDAYYATDDVCTHEFALLSGGWVEGDTVECPLHQARFHIPTGKCLGPPGDGDVATHPVKVEGTDIFVGIPVKG